MRTRGVARGVLGLAIASLLVAACGGEPVGLVVSPRPTPEATLSPQAGSTLDFDGPGPAAQALKRLCDIPGGDGGRGGSTSGAKKSDQPPTIRELAGQVEEVRELEFERPVIAEPLTKREIAREVRQQIERSLSGSLPGRRSLAWAGLGVIPEGTDLAKVYEELLAGQVVGFYVPETGRLVFVGSDDPGPTERLTLAHEMVHALDDQHFELDRISVLANDCREEEHAGALAAVEGSAMLFSLDLAGRFFSTAEAAEMLGESFGASGSLPKDTPEFVLGELTFSYLEGLAFMSAIEERGGLDAVNGALEELPVSTEQILHPDRYPDDVPRPVNVSDLGRRIEGQDWEDLDVMPVGEDFLSRMLALRVSPLEAVDAAAGWDGGLYRAWSDGDGDHVVVALTTAWDTEADAEAFADALQRYVDAAPEAAEQPSDPAQDGETSLITREGDRVNALFASDPAGLIAFTLAAGPVD